ncbi:hypothetical protein PR048_001528, partial [Dryococelus australis]
MVQYRPHPFTPHLSVKPGSVCLPIAREIPKRGMPFTHVAQRVEDIACYFTAQLTQKVSKFLWFSIALDETTNVSDTAQVLLFFRELVDLISLYGTTGEDIFKGVQTTLAEKYNLPLSWLKCVSTDGKNVCGPNKDFIGRMNAECEVSSVPKPLTLHCILHQEALCGKAVDRPCVMNPVITVVNFVQFHGLKHRLFKSALEEVESLSPDLPYNTAGKDNLICDLYTCQSFFNQKLLLFEQQISQKTFAYFVCYQSLECEQDSEFPLLFTKKFLGDLREQYSDRFSDLDAHFKTVTIFQNPLYYEIEDSAHPCRKCYREQHACWTATRNIGSCFADWRADFLAFGISATFSRGQSPASRREDVIETTVEVANLLDGPRERGAVIAVVVRDRTQPSASGIL